jgi:hypothetical protein
MVKINRRTAIKNTLAAAGGIGAVAFLPEKWIKPMLTSGVLPAHARGSQSNDLYTVILYALDGHLVAYTNFVSAFIKARRHNAAPVRVPNPAGGKGVTISGLITDSAGNTDAIRPALNARGVTGNDGFYDFGAMDKSSFCMVEWTVDADNGETASYQADTCADEVYDISLDAVDGDLVVFTFVTTAYNPGRRHNAAPLRAQTPIAEKTVTITGVSTQGAGSSSDITPAQYASGTTDNDGLYNFGAISCPNSFSLVTWTVKADNNKTASYDSVPGTCVA